MRTLFIYSLFISVFVFETYSKPTGVVEYKLENDGLGFSHFRYETEDGTIREETVEIVNKGTEDEHPVVMGLYSYTGPDGKKYQVRYYADDEGFKPLKDLDLSETPIQVIIGTSAIATLQGGGFG